MARQKIIHLHTKNPDISGPSAKEIEYGEIALNYADGHEKLYIKNSKDAIIAFPDENGTIRNATRLENHASSYFATASGLSSLKAKVEGIKIGGRNLMPNSAHSDEIDGRTIPVSSWGGNVCKAWFSHDMPEGIKGLSERYKVTATNGGGSYYKFENFILEAGETYTYSMYIKSNSGSDYRGSTYSFSLNRGSDNNYIIPNSPFTFTSEWTRIAYTFTVSAELAGEYGRQSIFYDPCDVSIAGFKLEKGNVLTDWTPNPYDIINMDAGTYEPA